MAYSACFLHQSALASSAARSSSSSSSQRYVSLSKPVQVVCKAQRPQEDDNSTVSRHLALTLLVGAAAVGSKVSPADAAYGEAGRDRKERTCLELEMSTNSSPTLTSRLDIQVTSEQPTTRNRHNILAHNLRQVHESHITHIHCGNSVTIVPNALISVSKKHVDFILGDNPRKMLYMVGFGPSLAPVKLH
ncbi:hypothetical protein Bca4012_016644 [Brassica carinata]